ncbi:hypothetical protein BJY00DRAFT_307826 [Aspergillus carlsbadensis]|nr:hypothetical protein BJY00DRAFT_307826 [Aspergillus carlsbadensis]
MAYYMLCKEGILSSRISAYHASKTGYGDTGRENIRGSSCFAKTLITNQPGAVSFDVKQLTLAQHSTPPPPRLTFPPEIKQMIYHFVMGYRTIHVRRPDDGEIYQRPYREWMHGWMDGRLDWGYFVCRYVWGG